MGAKKDTIGEERRGPDQTASFQTEMEFWVYFNQLTKLAQ
jgi:hypothetical protein